jgi:hypothetical protein
VLDAEALREVDESEAPSRRLGREPINREWRRIVDDVAAERRRLQGLGIVLGDDIEGDYSTLARVCDPDGNLLTLATPPSPPYPLA